MAFVCSIQDRWAYFDGIDQGSETVVIAGIGYDDSRPISYSVVAGLSPSGGGELEFFFYVTSDDAATQETRNFWSGREVANLMKPADRALVLAAALQSARMAVQHVNPVSFTYTTHDEHAPAASFLKHEAMHRVFEDLGYDIEVLGTRYGKVAWRMARD